MKENWVVVDSPSNNDVYLEGKTVKWRDDSDSRCWMVIRAASAGKEGLGLYSFKEKGESRTYERDKNMQSGHGWQGTTMVRPWIAREKDVVRRYELGLLKLRE